MKIVTQQDVVKNFMSILDKNLSCNAMTMLNKAVRGVTNNKCTTIDKSVQDMVNQCATYKGNGNAFLKEKCGIFLNNEDTGAISGADAGGVLKTAKSVIKESGSKLRLGSEYDSYRVWYDNKDSNLIVNYTDVGTVTNDKQHIMDCAYTWWMPNIVKLIDESYGYSFADSNATLKKIYLLFENGTGYLATTDYYRDGIKIAVNLDYYNSFKSDDYNCTSPNGQGYLDRTVAHETVHAIMMSKFKNRFWELPQFITEGTAELIHGIDDFRTNEIKALANDYNHLSIKLTDMNRGTGDSLSYAAGYMFLRWLAKQNSNSVKAGTF